MNDMPIGLCWFLRIVDGTMLLYWSLSALACLSIITLSDDLMYDGYGTATVDAWNWSFAPLDIAFAGLGLWSVRLAKRGDARWQFLCGLSLVLTMCAGGMAVAYWALLGEFNPAWWLPNALLLLFPMLWLPKLVASASSTSISQVTQ